MNVYITVGIAIYFIAFAVFHTTSNLKSSLLFRVLPFFSGLYLLLSFSNLYNSIAIGIIGILYIVFAFIMITRNFKSKIVYNIIPFISGLYLILRFLSDYLLLNDSILKIIVDIL